jgi:hypothetical protein
MSRIFIAMELSYLPVHLSNPKDVFFYLFHLIGS